MEKIADKYKSPEELFEAKEGEYGIFSKWKSKVDNALKNNSARLRAEYLSKEINKNKSAFSFFPGSKLKNQIQAGSYQIDSLVDSAYTYLDEVKKELTFLYAASDKESYKQLKTMLAESLPTDLIQLIELNSLGKTSEKNIENAIYAVQIVAKKNEYLEQKKEEEIENSVIVSDTALLDIHAKLHMGAPLSVMAYILIAKELNMIPNPSNKENHNAFFQLTAHSFGVSPKTVIRYYNGLNSGDQKNDPYKSQGSLESAIKILRDSKCNDLVDKLEVKLSKLV